MYSAADAGWPGLRVATLLILMGSLPANAHHSFANIYDTGQSVTLTGTVREFLFIHPHPFLVVEVRSPTGALQILRAEMDNRFELVDIGVTADTFRPGDRVTVSGSPGRTQADILYLWRLERPSDGLRYQQTGGTPSLDKG